MYEEWVKGVNKVFNIMFLNILNWVISLYLYEKCILNLEVFYIIKIVYDLFL